MNDINQQVTVMEQVIAKSPKGILLTCLNAEALKGTINKAIEMGIPVVTFDSDSPESKRYSFLGTLNYNAGIKIADEMAKLTNEKGEIGIVTVIGQPNLEERIQGFSDRIKSKYPRIKIISIQDGKADQITTAKVVGAMIQGNKNLAGIVNTEAVGAVGTAVAIREAGMAGKIKVISFDTDKGTLDAIKSGEISSTIAQGTYNMGYWSMVFAFHLAHDLPTPLHGDWKAAGVAPLPTFVDTGINVVTKENVDYYYNNFYGD